MTTENTPFAGAILTITIAVDSDTLNATLQDKFEGDGFDDTELVELIDSDFRREPLVSYAKALGELITMDPHAVARGDQQVQHLAKVVYENQFVKPTVVSVEAFEINKTDDDANYDDTRKRFADGVITERTVAELNNVGNDRGAIDLLAGKVMAQIGGIPDCFVPKKPQGNNALADAMRKTFGR